MAGHGESGSKVRSKIEASMEAAQAEQRQNLQRRRIDLARQGVRSYQLKRVGDAVRAFHTYIHILEDWKGVNEGGLHPTLFDLKKDLPELLLISGVYWDLVKLYDRTSSPEKQREFQHYMEKFIIFTKGLPYEPLVSETVRKYLNTEKPVHREQFKNAYKLISGNSCFVVTALGAYTGPDTREILREFRDEFLETKPWGRKLSSGYYRVGPVLARVVLRFPGPCRQALAKAFDVLALMIRRVR